MAFNELNIACLPSAHSRLSRGGDFNSHQRKLRQTHSYLLSEPFGDRKTWKVGTDDGDLRFLYA